MLMWIFGIGALVGALDYVFGNRLHLGDKFAEGAMCMGSMMLTMIGIMCLAPVLGTVLSPVLSPMYRALGMDPAMFASLLANNMGGYPLAMSMADDAQIGVFSGLVVSSMLGATVLYTIPVALSVITERDKPLFARGVMIGLIPIPIGALVGGLMMGLPLPAVLINLVPIILVAALLVVGFIKFPNGLLRGFSVFGKIVQGVSVLALGVASFTSLTGQVLIPGMTDIYETVGVVANMAIVQMGCMPVVAVLMRILRRPLAAAGRRLHINATAVAALPISCVNALSVYMMIKDMDDRGAVLSTAFITSSICLFTAHLAYTSAIDESMVWPVLAAKFISAMLALLLAYAMTRHMPDGAAQAAPAAEAENAVAE